MAQRRTPPCLDFTSPGQNDSYSPTLSSIEAGHKYTIFTAFLWESIIIRNRIGKLSVCRSWSEVNLSNIFRLAVPAGDSRLCPCKGLQGKVWNRNLTYSSILIWEKHFHMKINSIWTPWLLHFIFLIYTNRLNILTFLSLSGKLSWIIMIDYDYLSEMISFWSLPFLQNCKTINIDINILIRPSDSRKSH